MLNNISIHGRLTKDPELRQTQSGVSVCGFTVAVDRSYKSGEDKITDFFDCTAWRGLGEMISKYFTKGKEIVLSGEMQSNKWQDKEGNNRISWGILVNNVDFCGSKSDNTKAGNGTNITEQLVEDDAPSLEAISDDDLPF